MHVYIPHGEGLTCAIASRSSRNTAVVIEQGERARRWAERTHVCAFGVGGKGLVSLRGTA